jgi:hypothetical protein
MDLLQTLLYASVYILKYNTLIISKYQLLNWETTSRLALGPIQPLSGEYRRPFAPTVKALGSKVGY